MPINRKLAIQILKYVYENPDFYFPFIVVCREYTPEDNYFVEIYPEERKNIEDDEIYQTFQLWENLQDLKIDTTELLAKGFIEKIISYNLGENIKENINTLEFIGSREELYNPNFKGNEFETFKKEAGLNSFNLAPRKRIETTNAIGIISKAGRYGGGTFAHKDIAFEFATRLSPKFKLYLIKEFQRLKEQEVKALDWNVKRFLTKINYKIHTDAIKENLIPPELTKNQINFVYSDEADLLNVALFGQTAKEWREKNPSLKGNIRDEATIEQLIVLANIESMNAEYIKLKLPQAKRLELLNQTAISQIKSLLNLEVSKKLTDKTLI